MMVNDVKLNLPTSVQYTSLPIFSSVYSRACWERDGHQSLSLRVEREGSFLDDASGPFW
jgi:hypothetical protein